MQVTIKLKPHLQEFLLCSHGSNKVSYKDIYGSMLAPYLEYTPADKTPTLVQQEKSFLQLELAHWLGGKEIRNGSVYVSEENQKNFERTLSLYFREIFFNYMDDKIRYNDQIKICIEKFCMDYRISFDHITYEMLKKAYYRHQLKKKDEISTTKVSLNCPLYLN